jgi:toxic protein SymE
VRDLAVLHHPQGMALHIVVQHPRLRVVVSLYPGTMPRMPWIRLRGQWLQQAGFVPQARVRVRVMTGCLVITTE